MPARRQPSRRRTPRRRLRRLALGLLLLPSSIAGFAGAVAFAYVVSTVPLPGDIGAQATGVRRRQPLCQRRADADAGARAGPDGRAAARAVPAPARAVNGRAGTR